MTDRETEPRSFDTEDAEADRALESLRRGVERAREHVRRLRRNIDPDLREDG